MTSINMCFLPIWQYSTRVLSQFGNTAQVFASPQFGNTAHVFFPIWQNSICVFFQFGNTAHFHGY